MRTRIIILTTIFLCWIGATKQFNLVSYQLKFTKVKHCKVEKENSKECLECKIGFYLKNESNETKCIKCPKKCKKCKSESICEKCAVEYHLNNGKCEKCGVGCLSCDTVDQCSKCDMIYNLKEGQCKFNHHFAILFAIFLLILVSLLVATAFFCKKCKRKAPEKIMIRKDLISKDTDSMANSGMMSRARTISSLIN